MASAIINHGPLPGDLPPRVPHLCLRRVAQQWDDWMDRHSEEALAGQVTLHRREVTELQSEEYKT